MPALASIAGLGLGVLYFLTSMIFQAGGQGGTCWNIDSMYYVTCTELMRSMTKQYIMHPTLACQIVTL